LQEERFEEIVIVKERVETRHVEPETHSHSTNTTVTSVTKVTQQPEIVVASPNSYEGDSFENL